MGYFDDWASSPITTVGLPLAAGILASRNPTMARATGVGLGTLGLIQQAQARNEEDRRRQMFAQALPNLISATQPVTSTKVGIDPQTASYSLPDAPSQTAMKALSLTPQENYLYQTHLNNLRTNPVMNPDGSVSTLRQRTFEENGKTYNIPTIWDGAEHDPNVAWARAKKIGLANFPSYNSDQAAESRYQQMHDALEKDRSQAGPVNQWANIADSGPLAPPKPLPTYQATENKPVFSPLQQSVLQTVGQYDPETVARALASKAFLQQKETQPHFFTDTSTGDTYAVNPQTLEKTLINKGTPKKTTPPRPVFATQGGEGVTSQFNPTSGQWETTRQPLTAAPARQLSPEDQALKRAQTVNEQAATAERNARTARLAQITKDLQDPNASKDKLSTIYSVAIRDRTATANDFMLDPDEKQSRLQAIDAIIGSARSRLAQMMGPGGATQPGSAAAPAQGGAAMDKLPPAAKNNGRIIRDTATGARYQSDGKHWISVPPTTTTDTIQGQY